MEQRKNFLALILLDALEDEKREDVYDICRKNGVDASYVPTNRHISALHYAAGMENESMGLEFTKLFLQNGANPNTLSTDGMTPLHVAVIQQRLENVELLLKYGARVDIKDEERKTPMHYAVEYCNFELVELLRRQLLANKNSAKESQEAPIEQNGTPKNTTQDNKNSSLYYNYDRSSPYYINITHRRNQPQPKYPNLAQFDFNEKTPTERVNVFALTAENLRELSEQTVQNERSRQSLIDMWREKVQRTKARQSILKTFDNAEDLVNDVLANEHLNFNNILLRDASTLDSHDNEEQDNNAMPSSGETVTSKANNFLCNIIQQVAEAPIHELPCNIADSSYYTVPELQLNSQPMDQKDANANANNKECYIQMTEVYVHTDDENGLVFYETKALGQPQISNSPTSSLKSSSNYSGSTSLTVPAQDYETDALRAELTRYGEPPGPITKTTKRLYLRKLKKFKRQVAQNQSMAAALKKQQRKLNFSVELHRTIRCEDQYNRIADFVSYEKDSIRYFSNSKDMKQHAAREGHLKQSFIYMLMDPRITCNLPGESDQISRHSVWQRFLESIFYVGKGKTSRPYSHLYDAMKTHMRLNHSAQQQLQMQQEGSNKIARKHLNLDLFKSPPAKMSESKKLNRIIDIWADGWGVVCLHIFHNILPIDAYTREAAIIDALSLQHLTNEKRGVYYGPSQNWTMREKKYLGISLLFKALQIYLAEGESQLSPSDLI